MKYKSVIVGLFLIFNIGNSGFSFGDKWVGLSDESIDNSSDIDTIKKEDLTTTEVNSSEPISIKPKKIEKVKSKSTASTLEKVVKATKASGLISLYKKANFEYIWLGKREPKDITKELFNIIRKDATLPNSSTSKKKMNSLSKKIKNFYSKSKNDSKKKSLLDMEISKLYLNYAYYKIYGGINWTKFQEKLKELTQEYKIKVAWEYYRPPISPVDVAIEAVATNSLKDALNEAMPKRFKYAKLEKKLIEYMNLAKKGGWRAIPKYKTVKPNQTSPIVPKIRERLKLEDEAKKCETPANPALYDKCLQTAVLRYKVRHGLKVNKLIDSSLRRALNTPISKKIAKMRLNLDRIKWLYRDQEPLRIELNIPSFRLNLYDKDKIITTIRVIVGNPTHPTPVFHNVMKYVVVNPYWKIPESIVKHEMLKHLIKDPYYYERKGKILKKSWDENSPRVDPGSVNWRKYYKNRDKEDMHIPYYFMQLPGSRNALGKIKFLFPNKYSVYIHDTPAKRLFFRTTRAFSHGCMRIQKPRELLKMLALYNENIDVDAIMDKLGTTEKETLVLRKSVPVDITYLTAFVDDYGNLHFRNDIYKYDKYQFENYRYPDLIGKKANKSKKKNKTKTASKTTKKPKAQN